MGRASSASAPPTPLPSAPIHEADGCVTTEPGIACVVQAADCLPVLLAAPGGRAVGAAHAGWRGLAAGVVEAAVAAVSDAAHCAPEEISRLARRLHRADAVRGRRRRSRRFRRRFRAAAGAAPPRFVARAGGKWLADLPGLARDRLAAAGVRRVAGGDWCTVSDRSRFFSFRRDGVTGRMAAAIWITRPS